jgi:hypothetical protein
MCEFFMFLISAACPFHPVTSLLFLLFARGPVLIGSDVRRKISEYILSSLFYTIYGSRDLTLLLSCKFDVF